MMANLIRELRLGLTAASTALTLLAAGSRPAPAQAPQRGPEVERLGLLVGKFEGPVQSRPPGGAAQQGVMQFEGTWDLDGWIVRANYAQQYGKRPAIRGLLVFRWRPRDSTYAFEAYANTPMEPHRLNGRWDNGRLVYEGAMQGTAFRETWEARGADTLVTAMEFRRGDQWIRVSEATLTRQR